MKKSAQALLEALTVLIPGALALWILGRTLTAYWGRDRIASTIVCAMALCLVAGSIELLLRQRRASRIELEVRALPPSPSEATVDGASPMLSALLRARLEQGASATLGEGVASTLTGLLVMLGLLGTLLGLFEAVQGAGDALTTSADVGALRRSLTTPIDGLRRSFGCSAAGISASALLGLALALVRRRESRTLRAIHGYVAGPLRVLSPARRQARALEQLATQGLALPQTSTALEQVGGELRALSSKLLALQESALDGQKHALEQLLGGLRGELGAVAADAGASLHARIAPLVESAVASTSEAARAQADAVAMATRGITDALTKVTHDITRELGDVTRSVSHELGDVTRSVSHELGEATRGVSHELGEIARGVGRELAETRRALADELASDAQARREEASTLLLALSQRLDQSERTRAEARQAELAQLAEVVGRTLAEAEQREQALTSRWSALSATMTESIGELRAQEEARQGRLDQLASRVGEDLGRLSEQLSEQLARRLESEGRHEASTQAAMERLGAAAAQLEAHVGQSGATVETLVERLPPLLTEVATATQASAQQALDRLAESATAAQREAAEVIARLAESTDTRLAQMSDALASQLENRVESEKAHDERARATMERLAESASLIELSIDSQREQLEALVARVGARFDEVSTAARASADATLAQLVESAREQAQHFVAFEDKLGESRSAHTRELAQELAAQAERLADKLGGASAVVQEAASIWKASSVEMQAIADLFARSIERQREASDAFLESLGEVEGAVERAGRHAAADALSDQLASTQEVFARQLQFQRELFEQLRLLRGGTSRPTHGEHDVPV